jgi:hypothetical protein
METGRMLAPNVMASSELAAGECPQANADKL